MNIDLAEILTNSHVIRHTNEGSCCYGDTITCACGWSGDPYQYGKHILVTLGLVDFVLQDWLNNGWLKPDNLTERNKQEYLNIFRGPKDTLSKKQLRELVDS